MGMTSTGHIMQRHPQPVVGHDRGSAFHELHLQCLRILRCTAKALASSPGGLRFKAGTRPWLEGITGLPQAQLPAGPAHAPRSLPSSQPRHRGFFTARPGPAFSGHEITRS
ncbi:MAG: hypothetical protein JWQ72_164 [Polaromonas sp.]|nr:hypothetical protein [Polaromonas sp.]